jgi:valyl-tRNA synthetase
MQRFPLAGGGSVGLESSHITSDSLAQARQRLDKAITELTQHLRHLSKTIATMEQKAPAEIVEQKKEAVAQLQSQLDETQRSRDALTPHDAR